MVGDLVAGDSEQPGQCRIRRLVKLSPCDHETGRYNVVNVLVWYSTSHVLGQSLIVFAEEILEAIEDSLVGRSTKSFHYLLYVSGQPNHYRELSEKRESG